MQIIEHEGMKINVDEDGFLVSSDEWSEAVAKALAAREGIHDLSEASLDILKFMRDYYRKHSFFPIVRFVCRNIGQGRNCVTEKFIDPVTAWKVAGLPNPGEEVRGFRSWEPLGY